LLPAILNRRRALGRIPGVIITEESPARPVGQGPLPRGRRWLRRALGALAGLLAAAVALGVAELIAGIVGPASSPVIAVGNAAITLTPEPVKEFAIRNFGQNDKRVLVGGVLVVIALYALVVGLVALRSRRLGALGVAVFGVLGVVAALTRPAGTVLDGLPSLIGGAVGVVALLALTVPLVAARPGIQAVPARGDEPAPGAPGKQPVADRVRAVLGSTDRSGMALDRRRFFVTSGVAVGVAALAGGGGRLLQRRFDVADARNDLTLPAPASPAPALPAGADLAATVDGVTPLFTANPAFYRVDTAITVPQIRPADYQLSLTGMFDRKRTFSLQDLFDRDDIIERDLTLTCVSNEVGGTLAGTARWLGVPLGAFLKENGVRSGSSQLVCRSVDGMTIGAPTKEALQTPDAMLAFGMNGEPLPVEHGFPVRMIIPGLYGYVSACKWLTEIQATTYEAFDPYWVARDWVPQAPIKVASRIDTPAALRTFAPGPRPIAGVAWAQTRGIASVEVRVDDGDWMQAQLSPETDADLWRQWMLPFDFPAGTHTLTVRATSADGQQQTQDRADPFPSGSTGWHSIQVIVR
jgi:DMSO/TMAO reductase YedYZ molybdopterin-dependent catalytic subunit